MWRPVYMDHGKCRQEKAWFREVRILPIKRVREMMVGALPQLRVRSSSVEVVQSSRRARRRRRKASRRKRRVVGKESKESKKGEDREEEKGEEDGEEDEEDG